MKHKKVFFHHACVNYDVIGYVTSPCLDEWSRPLQQYDTLEQGYTRLKISIYFHIYIQGVSFLLVFAVHILFFSKIFFKKMH